MEKSDPYDRGTVVEDADGYKTGTSSRMEDEEIISRTSPADTKRLMRRIDVRLIPLCGVMYCVSLLDRTNLSNAAIAGYAPSQYCKRARLGD